MISQSPTQGVRVPPTQTVDLVVSSGPRAVRVPNVVGLLESDATRILENDGFDVQVIREPQSPDCEQEAGRVCLQDPEAGESVEEGSTVTITVADEPEPEPECNNGIDDDEDGFTDHPADPGCQNPNDDDETDLFEEG